MTKPKQETQKDAQAPEGAEGATETQAVVPQAVREQENIRANKAGNPGFPEDTSAQDAKAATEDE